MYQGNNTNRGPKKRLSLVLRDQNEESHRSGVSSMLVSQQSDGKSVLFSASRDRLIKMWDLDYDT
jgi:WD40 repeat protein